MTTKRLSATTKRLSAHTKRKLRTLSRAAQPTGRSMIFKPFKRARPGVCPGCGCSENDPCTIACVPCAWVNYQGQLICTACAPIEALVFSETGRDWLRTLMHAAKDNAFPISAGIRLDYEPCDAQLKRRGELP